MALPHLIKYIYNNGTDEVIRRGKKIFSSSYVEIIENDELLASIVFRVRDDAYNTYYKVYVSRYNNVQTLSVRCSCPYNLGDICRHEAAALFRLQELVDSNQLGETEKTEFNQQHTAVKMKQLELRSLRLLSAPDTLPAAENYLRSHKANILEAANDLVKAELNFEGKNFSLQFRRNDERNLDTRCNCNSETKYPLCVHKAIVLLQLLSSYGPTFFETISNRDREKNKLLALYGYSTDDDIEGKFEFTYRDGKPFLRVLDSSIKRIVAPPVEERRPFLAPLQKEVIVEEKAPAVVQHQKLGVALRYDTQQYPFIQVDVVKGEPDEANKQFTGKIERLDLTKFVNTEDVDEDDKMLIQHLRKLLPSEVTRYLNRNSPFSGIWENIIQQHNDELPEETRYLIIEYLLPKYKKLFSELSESNFAFTLPQHKSFVTANLQQAILSNQYIQPQFNVSFNNGVYEASCYVKLLDGVVPIEQNGIASPLVFQSGDTFYLWQKTEDALLAERFLGSGKISIVEEDWNKQLVEFILPLTKNYDVQFTGIQKEEIRNVQPEMRLLLREKGEYLLFQPYFNYNGYDVKQRDRERIIVPSANKLIIIHRNAHAEKELVKKIANLHSSFIHPEDSDTLALKGSEVLKNNWFFLFGDAVKEMNIPVYGYDALKKFRFNTAKPSTKIFISSNTDWFDAKIDIHFGDQKVTVSDVKKALASKQQFVPLQDGTLGILPEDWLRRYSMLFRVGEGRATNIKLSKYHFGVIEELYQQRNDEEIFFKLEEKYERLKGHHTIKEIAAPVHLQNILRPYQVAGFQWLNYLSEVNWGGILADDMGLGKTVQSLSFLHHYKEVNGKIRALVVCPTTLMFNWENEIRKFTPTLTWFIHHGSGRSQQSSQYENADIVITTYGTLRSDIQLFTSKVFDYVILDESQAIKNPQSKVTKAATLLNAKNRLCMSGTPLQNNTFDMYAQMNFLNPGMLGSMDFFKQEFSIPIDKFGEKEQKEHLRKLLYPFLLRRTKEQVAKDLPEKSEMILFCEMGDEQRKIYDAYRNDFRDKILGVVDDKGVQKSQLTILQGLMKLRQICDSPAIIKDEEKYPNVSVKLEELGREISENIGDHKALIFSQFLGMLALIRAKMKELGIDYEYFDGSTSAPDREKAINRFQNDDNCRVFLISLKAGGVGLNLTAADYVYIVDPWWNPAVEQQAIDRTHRIGQTKNIFAYRMICKDTVEDKILKLQERKRALAAELITDDVTFVKSLSREDVEYLFS